MLRNYAKPPSLQNIAPLLVYYFSLRAAVVCYLCSAVHAMAYRAMPYAAQTQNILPSDDLHRRRGVWHTPEVRKLCYAAAAVCDAVHAMAYRAMPYAAQTQNILPSDDLHRRRGVWHTPEVRKLCYAAAAVCDVVHAMAYRAYATRPYKWRKTIIAKITWDMGKTMSHVGKIMSDIIQTTSDLFSPFTNI